MIQFKGERNAVPEIVVFVVVRIPDVELEFRLPPMMKGPIIECRLGAENLVTWPAIQIFQLFANFLQLADGVRWPSSLSFFAISGMLRDMGRISRCCLSMSLDWAAESFFGLPCN